MKKQPVKETPKKLNINSGLFEAAPVQSWQERYKPADTLGKPSKAAQLANDAACQSGYGLLAHSFDMGQLPSIASFVGYAALQDMSQNGLIRACIETVADDMTREFGQVKSRHEGRTDFIDSLTEALEKMNVQGLLHHVAEMVGYFGGCLVYIDTGADEAERQLPLNMSKFGEVADRGVKCFRLIDPINCYPGIYNSTDPLADHFYDPEYWFVMGKQVHASRMIRFVANEVPQLLKPVYNFFGIAQAQLLWDYVMHFNKCRVATAEMVTKYSQTVFKTDMGDTLFNAAGSEQIDKRMMLMSKYRDNNSVIALDNQTEDLVKVESTMAGLTDIGKQALEFLTAINRTPAVKLLGISPSGFNATGESDWRNYADHVSSQQEKVFGAGMKRILDLLCLTLFKEENDGYFFEWKALGEADENAVAMTEQTKANTAAIYLDRGIISAEEARQAIVADEGSTYAFIDPEEVPEQPQDEMQGAAGGIDDIDKAGAIEPAEDSSRSLFDFFRGDK